MAIKRRVEKVNKERKEKPPLALAHGEPLHVAAYGDYGAGKTEFFATFETPICVWMFDGVGKDRPYRRRGTCKFPMEALPLTKWGNPYQDVLDPKGKLLIRIEYYRDPVVNDPHAAHQFLDRISRAKDEMHRYRTFVLDSASMLFLTSRKMYEYDIEVDSKDGRKWYAGSTDVAEEVLLSQLPALPCNVGVALHIARTKVEEEGSMTRSPFLPGRLNASFGTQWPEIYRVYVGKPTAEGEKPHLLQTQASRRWVAATQIHAPDPCEPTFESLWEGAD